jgi:hypothetical protein
MSFLDKARKAIAGRPARPHPPAVAPSQPYEINEGNEKSPFDAALAEALALLDGEGVRLAAGRPARVNVLEVYREVVRGLHARRDPLLFDAAGQIRQGLLARWTGPKDARRRTRHTVRPDLYADGEDPFPDNMRSYPPCP